MRTVKEIMQLAEARNYGRLGLLRQGIELAQRDAIESAAGVAEAEPLPGKFTPEDEAKARTLNLDTPTAEFVGDGITRVTKRNIAAKIRSLLTPASPERKGAQ